MPGLACAPWRLAALVATALAASAAAPAAARLDPEHLDFFESRIRPVLIDSCYPCHSVESGRAQGGLRVDSAAALIEGGDRGPAVTPGDPESSWLIKAIRQDEHDLLMPPNSRGGKLPSAVIEDLLAWVILGAPDPRTGTPASTATPADPASGSARDHWAFQPITAPEPPPVRRQRWVRNPIDAFILAKLEEQDLEPARSAHPRTLLRRLSYGLTGLPPSPEAMNDFLSAATPKAYERAVDRLLASPHYGERWARHWLDVARYADTKGYVFQEERRFPYAYTYRDYVIRAFNDDKPYDRFLLEQIAADQLEPGEDRASLAALGFLTLGRRFLNNQHDIIDDRIDVVTRGTLGLTVSCARCHDHKFDPIPIDDYYALHGVFASSEEPAEKPLLAQLEDTPAYRDYLERRGAIETEIADITRREIDQSLAKFRRQSGDYLRAAHEARAQGHTADLDDFAGVRKLTPLVLKRWIEWLEQDPPVVDPILDPWFAYAALSETQFDDPPATLAALLRPAEEGPERPVNGVVLAALRARPPASLEDLAKIYTDLFTEIDSAWESLLAEAARSGSQPPGALPDPDRDAIRRFLEAEDSPAKPPREQVQRLLARHIGNATVGHRQRIEALSWTHPGAPPRAMVLVDKERPANSRLLRRGNPGTPGPEVPRRFLSILSELEPRPFRQGSGRLELARAIARPDNPLTARVFVNRVWGWHFGKPLVDTPSDFGVRTEPPLHQDLLDWLAARFIAEGWSVKSLHRLILLSNTYRQSSQARPGHFERDPHNQYLSRFNRQRLDLEAMRDTLLLVAGRLDPALGGQPVDLLAPNAVPRRTVYGFIDRQNLPGLFRTFDFANPDSSQAGRFQTTVPQQALFLMNSPFVIEQARALAQRAQESAGTLTSPTEVLYRLVYQRPPLPREQRWAAAFLRRAPDLDLNSSEPPNALTPWEQFAQVLLLSNELLFVD